MKIRIGFGPPPRDLLLEGSRKIRRKKEVWKTPHRVAELHLREGIYLDDLSEDGRRDNFSDFVAHVKLEKRDEHHFGGTVRRRIDVREIGPDVDESVRVPHLWAEVLGPINPWEAWRMACEWKMELQGIELRHEGRTWRVHQLPFTNKLSFAEFDDNNHVLELLTPDLQRRHETEGNSTNDPSYEFYPRLYSNRLVAPKRIEMLMFVQEMVPITEDIGWSVAGVWQLHDLQAQAFNMTMNQLVTRLKRRSAAAKRKREAR